MGPGKNQTPMVAQHTVKVSAAQSLLATVGRKGWVTAFCVLMLLLVLKFLFEYVGTLNPVIPAGIGWAAKLLVGCSILLFLVNSAWRARTWRRARRVVGVVEANSARIRWIGHRLDLDWAKEMGRRADCDGIDIPYSPLGTVLPEWAVLPLMVISAIFIFGLGKLIGMSVNGTVLTALLVFAGLQLGFDHLFPACVQLAGQTLVLSGIKQLGGENSSQQVIPLESASVHIWAIDPSLMTFSWKEDGSHREAAVKRLPIEYCYYVFCAAITSVEGARNSSESDQAPS